MADEKLTALVEETAPIGTDLAYIVDDPAGAPASRKATLANLRQGVMGAGERSYYEYLCALLEPDAIEPLQWKAAGVNFNYVVGAAETKIVVASHNTRIGGAGRMEVRLPHEPLPLRGVTFVGGVLAAGTSSAVIVDPTIPTYTDPVETYHQRLVDIMELPTKNVSIAAATTQIPLLPGAYGAIITAACIYEFTWITADYIYNSVGWTLQNELGDAGGDEVRFYTPLRLAVDKKVINAVRSGAAAANAVGTVSFVLLPSTWSVVTDPLAPYDFRDDFMGASIDTVTDWTRVQATIMEIDTLYQWLETDGNAAWGTNSMFSQSSIARAVGKVFLCDVYTTGPIVAGSVTVGFHDGAGHLQTDFAYGVSFSGGGGVLNVYENGNARGVVGAGYSVDCTYRIRITLEAAGAAKYEIQGGSEYESIGDSAWTDITPGVTSSATDPLHAGVANWNDPAYVGDVRMY